MTFAVFNLLLQTAFRGELDLKSAVAISAEMLALPAFWFGGPWLTTSLMESVSSEDFVEPYLISLAITFGLPSIYPLARLSLGGVQ